MFLKNKAKLYKIVFESDTRAGKLFGIVLIWVIGFSVAVAMFDSIPNPIRLVSIAQKSWNGFLPLLSQLNTLPLCWS